MTERIKTDKRTATNGITVSPVTAQTKKQMLLCYITVSKNVVSSHFMIQ